LEDHSSDHTKRGQNLRNFACNFCKTVFSGKEVLLKHFALKHPEVKTSKSVFEQAKERLMMKRKASGDSQVPQKQGKPDSQVPEKEVLSVLEKQVTPVPEKSAKLVLEKQVPGKPVKPVFEVVDLDDDDEEEDPFSCGCDMESFLEVYQLKCDEKEKQVGWVVLLIMMLC
jgi:hypothetical protein